MICTKVGQRRRCFAAIGDNSRGQLGDGGGSSSGQKGVRSLAIRIYPNLVQDPLNFGSPPLSKIALGGIHTCALTGAGGVKCWGSNAHGQLGDGTNTDSDIPVSVAGLSSEVVGLAAGGLFTCALTSAGGAKCWGYNHFGQLGDGANINSNVAHNVVGLSSGVVKLTAGFNHTCALTKAGGVMCWGSNSSGQLGNSTYVDSNTPVNVSGLSSGVIGLFSGRDHNCALTSVGGVKCWGVNDYAAYTYQNTPVAVAGLSSGVVELAATDGHTCALLSDRVKCWGLNGAGELGNGTNTNSNTPVDVSGLSSGVIGLTAGTYYTCALLSTGGVKCWGLNSYGQLGDGTNINRNTPVNVTGLADGVTLLAAGGYHTCAGLAGVAPLRCWGDNSYGQLGDGTKTTSHVPVISKWLTADGLVDDQKAEVILPPILHVAVVIPPQSIVTPVVVEVTQVPTPPASSADLVPVDVALQYDILSDEKPRLPMFFHWDYSFYGPPAGSPHSAAGFDEQSLNLYKYVNGAWVPMLPCTGCSLDTTNDVLIATPDGPGIYAVMAGPLTGNHSIYLPIVMR